MNMPSNNKKRLKIGLNKNCQICNKIFYVPPSFKDQKFCSPKCYYQNKKGQVPWNKGKRMPESFMKKLSDRPQHFGLGHIPHNKGKPWSEEIKKKMSENRKGKVMGKDNPSNRPEQRERNRLRMKKVWETPIERQRYSKGWFQKGDPRFKSDPIFIEGMKKGSWNKGDKRLLENKFGFKKGQIPHNKIKLPPESEMRSLYEKEMKDAREIAEIYGSNMNTILRWLNYYKIKKRKSLYGCSDKIICKAGHKVDSIGERKIADFLLKNGISYFHNKTI